MNLLTKNPKPNVDVDEIIHLKMNNFKLLTVDVAVDMDVKEMTHLLLKRILLNEILEDSDYDDLDSASAPRPESRSLNTSALLRDIHKNMDEFDSTSASYPESLQGINRNIDDLENSLAPSCPRFRNSDLSTPLREVSRSRNLDTSTPLREVHRNTDEFDSVSAHLRSGSRDLNTPASLCLINTSASPTLPPCFNDIDTIFQLTTWLCANPNVLQFANNAIYSSMQTSLANGQQFTPSNLANPTALQLQSPLQVDKSQFFRRTKCFFLRVRNPPKHVLEELIRQIIKCNLNSVEGLEWLSRIGFRQFGDFRNKFLDGIEKLVNSFKEKRNKQGILETTLPQKEDIDDFIDEEK
ncbi:hypothetical protein RhiirA4_484524 [Rhizophagus irregularis]|uniref:Uncharacterized protein n=1 Tax=Rhizophagus irregularis TaxID=588596 RepID=A0A2I1HP11_9GLOM|nr:hypothetical protein RhiirA4_484524 [Rhizophagus irregularis]